MACLFWGRQFMKPSAKGVSLKCQMERMCSLYTPCIKCAECPISGLKEVVGLPYTLWLPVSVVSPCLFQNASEAPTETPQAPKNQSFMFQMRSGSLYIDGIEVLTAKSKQYFAVFKILWVQYCNDLLENQTAKHYTFLSLADIADRMPRHVEDIDTIRRYIKHLQADINQLLKNTHGGSVEHEAIIQSALLKNIGRKKHGYRLNPYTLHIVPC